MSRSIQCSSPLFYEPLSNTARRTFSNHMTNQFNPKHIFLEKVDIFQQPLLTFKKRIVRRQVLIILIRFLSTVKVQQNSISKNEPKKQVDPATQSLLDLDQEYTERYQQIILKIQCLDTNTIISKERPVINAFGQAKLVKNTLSLNLSKAQDLTNLTERNNFRVNNPKKFLTSSFFNHAIKKFSQIHQTTEKIGNYMPTIKGIKKKDPCQIVYKFQSNPTSPIRYQPESVALNIMKQVLKKKDSSSQLYL